MYENTVTPNLAVEKLHILIYSCETAKPGGGGAREKSRGSELAK